MSSKWTDEQQSVISSRGSDLLVAAAAGSGKTAVLIERIISIITDTENPIDIDRMLVVTFTNAAASEMKSRVKAALDRKIEENPDDVHIQRQLLLLNKAEIQTIHSFCLNVVKNNFHLVDLDSNIRIGEESEFNTIKEDILNEMFEEYYREKDEGFLNLVNWYDDKGPEASLSEMSGFEINDLNKMVLSVFKITESMPFPEEWIEKSCEKFNVSGVATDNDSYEAEFASQAHLLYPYMRSLADIVLEFSKRYREKKKSMSLLEFSDLESYAIEILVRKDEDGCISPTEVAKGYQDRYEYVFTDEYQDSNPVQEVLLSAISRKENPNRFMVGDIKQSIYGFRQAKVEIFLEKYERYSRYDREREASGESLENKILLYKNFRSRREVLEACNYVFSKIMRKETGMLDYTEEERLNAGADFGICEDGVHAGPVEVYLVDSDSTPDKEQQEIIDGNIDIGFEYNQFDKYKAEFSMICRIINNMVGKYMIQDKKSGEYRTCRYSDIVILMKSAKNEINTINLIMQENRIPFYTEIGNSKNINLEVEIFINLLKIIDNPYDDIPLLSVMRSPMYEFTSNEMARIRLVDRENLIYPILGKILEDCTEDVVIDDSLKSKISKFLDDIDSFRKSSRFMSMDELVWYLFRATGYYDYVGLLEKGDERQKNLMMIYEKARDFESQLCKGLFNFLAYLEKTDLDAVNSQESEDGELDDCVRLMTIHKSKGLEFPVVIIANSDRNFNPRNRDSLLVDADLGFGPKIIDRENHVSYSSIARDRIADKLKKELWAEEMRVLYVAMTRAKEKLIFTGTCKKNDRKFWEEAFDVEEDIMPDEKVMSAKSYMNWIMPLIYKREADNAFVNVFGEEAEYTDVEGSFWYYSLMNRADIFMNRIASAEEIEEEDEQTVIEIDKEEIEKSAKELELLERRLDPEYRYKSSAGKPTVISVTEIKKNLMQDNPEFTTFNINRNVETGETEENYTSFKEKSTDNLLKKPSFMHKEEEESSFKPSERGTFFHLVMQLLDFEQLYKVRNAQYDTVSESDNAILQEIKRQIQGLVERRTMDREEADTVNIKWILRFVKSHIFRECMKSYGTGMVYREKAIDYSINVNEVFINEDIPDSEKMLLVGMADLFYENSNGNLVLIDYKTDYCTRSDFMHVVDRYRIQIEYYRRALEKTSGKKVEKSYIYLMRIGRAVRMEDSI